MRTSEHIDKYAAAIVAARRELKNPVFDATVPVTKSGITARYATLQGIINTITEVLSKHGLIAMQDLEASGSQVSVKTIIMHESGQFVEYGPFSVPTLSADPKTYGSAATYARRYHLPAVLGLASEEDDGGAALMEKTIANDLIEKWVDKANDSKNSEELKKIWAEGIAEIKPTGNRDAYKTFKAAVESKGKELSKKAEE